MSNSIRTFYVILITQALSMIGSQMTAYGIGVYLFLDTGDITPLAGVTFFSSLAAIIVTGFAGVWADRYDRRLMMVYADVGQAVCTGVLLAAFWLDGMTLAVVFGVTFVQRMFGALQMPAFTASITMLVPDDRRDMANGLMQLSGSVSQVFALIAAGIIYSLIALGGIIFIDLLTFGVAMAVMAVSHIPAPPRTEPNDEPLLQQLSFGARWLWRHQPIFQATLAATLANFFLLMSTIMFTPLLLIMSDNNTTITGIVSGIGAAGGIAGALSMGYWQHVRPRMKVVTIAMSTSGLFLMVMGIVDRPWLFALAMFAMVTQFPVINSMFISMMQQKVPAQMQGRVIATVVQLAMLIQPLAAIMVGPLADHVFEPAVGGPGWDRVAWLVGDGAGAGIRLLIIINGLLMALIVGAILLRPAVRNLEANLPDPEPPPAAPTVAPVAA